jgi:hypothetical protein
MEYDTWIRINATRVAVARYIVVDGVLRLLAVDGAEVSGLSEKLEPSGNANAVASRLARRWSATQPPKSDFNRALPGAKAPF